MNEHMIRDEPFPGFEVAIQELPEIEREECGKCRGRGWVPSNRAYQRVYRRFQRWAAKAGKNSEHEGSGT